MLAIRQLLHCILLLDLAVLAGSAVFSFFSIPDLTGGMLHSLAVGGGEFFLAVVLLLLPVFALAALGGMLRGILRFRWMLLGTTLVSVGAEPLWNLLVGDSFIAQGAAVSLLHHLSPSGWTSPLLDGAAVALSLAVPMARNAVQYYNGPWGVEFFHTASGIPFRPISGSSSSTSFFERSTSMSGPYEPLSRRVRRISWRAVKDFVHYQGMNQSAALAFFALMSFIPTIFLILAVAAELYGDTETVQQFIEEQSTLFVPWLQDMVRTAITRFLEISKSLGMMSLGFIIWTAGLLFASLQNNMILPWVHEGHMKRGFLRLIFPWLLGPVLGFLMIGAMLFMHISGYIPWDRLPIQLSPTGLSWLTLGVFIFLLYRLLLPLRAPWIASFCVSLTVSGFSLGLTEVFVTILSSLPNYALVYGSLASLVLFLLWLNYNMALILIGSHFIRRWGTEDEPCDCDIFEGY